MMKPDISTDELADKLRGLSKDELRQLNEKERERTKAMYDDFRNSFTTGLCSICNKPLKTFSVTSPCLHWLLRPNGFRKKHFPLLYRKFSYFRMEAYVRWVASIESPVKNINDIREKHPGSKLFDFTAKYHHITWSFSCSGSDFAGHEATAMGNMPHYHFQMQLEGKPFIDYSDFHVPFHKDDLFNIELLKKHGDIVKQDHGPGTGMNMLLDSEEGLEFVIEHSLPTDNPEEAAYRLDTVITAPDGKTLSGEVLHQAINEAKQSGETVASMIRKRFPEAQVRTLVSPGGGVPEAKPRGKKKRGT